MNRPVFSAHEFQVRQEQIYDSFRQAMRRVEPPVVSADLKDGAKGFVLALRYGAEVTDLVESFNDAVLEVAPSVRYSARNVHTTVTEYGRNEAFDDGADPITADRIMGLARTAFSDNRPTIRFNEWLFNESAAVLAGYPNSAFVNGVIQLLAGATRYGMLLRPPWGGHITVARFCDTAGAMGLSEPLLKIIAKHPLPAPAKPTSLELCSFRFDACSYTMETIDSLTWRS